MASTLKVNRIETPDGLGNISFAQPISGDGAQLTNLNVASSNLTNLPAAELVGTIASGVDGSGLINLAIPDDSITGGKIDLSLVAGDIIYANNTDSIQRLAKGTDGEVLTLASGVPSWSAAGGGSFLQVVPMAIAKASGSTTIVESDAVPTISNGTEIGTQAIVMADDTNKVLVAGGIQTRCDTGTRGLIITIFRATTCIGVWTTIGNTAQECKVVGFSFLDAPATAGSVTYSVRAMCGTTGSWFINDEVTADDFGGATVSAITLSEVNV